MHKGVYSFEVDRNQPLSSEAERAVNRIYGAGLMFRNGAIGPGGNNVMADSAARAFTAADLVNLNMAGGRDAKFAEVISLRQSYADQSNDVKLTAIFDAVQALKADGWQPESEPVRIAGPTCRPTAPGPA